MMKRDGLVFAAVMVFGAMTMAAQTSATVKDDLFNGTEMFAKGASDVTEVTMDPQTLSMVGGKDSAKAHRALLTVVRKYTYDKPGMYKIEDVETFRNKLNTGEWHCSVHTRSMKTGESTDVCNKQRTDGYMETAIITVEPKELTFVHTITKQNQNGSEMGDMPLGMMTGMNALSSLAMISPDSMADMAVLQAQMGAVPPSTLMLDIPNKAETQELLDLSQKLKKDPGFVLKVPNNQKKQPEQSKPAPDASQAPN